MRKFLLTLVIILAFSGSAFAQTIIGPSNTENGRGNLNAAPNAQSLATGGTGIGYGGNVYAPDYSYRPQSNYNNNNVHNNTSIYSPSSSYSGASSSVDNEIQNDVNNTNINRVRIDNNPTINTRDTNVNVNINKPEFTNRNVIERGAVQNDNRNMQGQSQDQGQLQLQGQRMDQGQDQAQGQNNEQTIAPSQSVEIKIDAPKRPLPNIPSSGVPEQNYVHQDFFDFTRELPDFMQVQLTPYAGEEIVKVLYTIKKVKYDELIPTLLDKRDKVLGKARLMDVRIIVLVQEGQRSWSIGSPTIAGASSSIGAAGSTGLVGGIGETYAKPRFTIHFVEVR